MWCDVCVWCGVACGVCGVVVSVVCVCMCSVCVVMWCVLLCVCVCVCVTTAQRSNFLVTRPQTPFTMTPKRSPSRFGHSSPIRICRTVLIAPTPHQHSLQWVLTLSTCGGGTWVGCSCSCNGAVFLPPSGLTSTGKAGVSRTAVPLLAPLHLIPAANWDGTTVSPCIPCYHDQPRNRVIQYAA